MSETEQKKMETINSKLDEILIEFFDSLGELYKEQANLENIMKNGFLMMSRARYNMGAKSVGALQYNENMKASKVVIVTKDDVSVTNMFELVDSRDYPVESLDDSDAMKGHAGLRQRKVGGSEKVETIESDSGDKFSENNANCKNSKTKNDPINWFGVLVPQTLRQSQGYFKQATESVVTVSNLKSKVLNLRDQYKSLMKEKQMMAS